MQYSGPARGFGFTVFGALLIQVYGIFLSQFGYELSCFSSILGIQFIDKLNFYFSVEAALLTGYCFTILRYFGLL